MKYRRFGRTELQMPVISCGGMRYQYKWQDVSPRRTRRQPDESRSHDSPGARTRDQPHRDRPGLRPSEMQLGSVLPSLPRDKIIVQTKVAPHASPEEFLKTFDQSMKYSDWITSICWRCMGSKPATAPVVPPKERVCRRRSPAATGRPGSVSGVFNSRHDRHHSGCGEQQEFDYVNLHW